MRKVALQTLAGKAAALLAAALGVGALMAAPVRAGTIWVTDGDMAGQNGNCNAFGVAGNLSVFSVPSRCPMSIAGGSVVPPGQNAFWMTTAPPGITINSAWTTNGDVTSSELLNGWVVGDFWQDKTTGAYHGSTLAAGQHWFNTGVEGRPDINSQIYGIQLVCSHSPSQGSCLGIGPPQFAVRGIELAGTETSAPSIVGTGTLWNEPAGQYVWNPPGQVWSVGLDATDSSGVCGSSANVGDHELSGPPESRDTSVWQQCPSPVIWYVSVDTRTSVPNAGALVVHLNATNAAGVLETVPRTINVDNDPVIVTLTTPNDPDTNAWVNHSVTVRAAVTTGPSGVAGTFCHVDRAGGVAYPAAGVVVNGDGTHTVSCTAVNNAVSPGGPGNAGTSAITVHIDEAPPSLTFEPQNSRDPTKLVIDTSDAESGVAAGSVQVAPAGTNNWTSLPTSFDGSHLTSRFDDSSLHGQYTFRATSCDAVGNCRSTTERLALPLRLASDQQVSLMKIVDPLRRQVVTERVRVGWHWATIHRGGKLLRVKRGGHVKTIKVTKFVERCTTRRVRNPGHGWRLEKICRPPHVRVTKQLWVPYGQSVTIHGLYTTGQGTSLANQPVHILAAPDNHSNAFAELATAITGSDGSWSATLPPGPSRIIRAVTDGTATILPSSGQVTTVVPARIRLVRVWPRHVAWGGTVHLVGQLFGGYLPPDGALVRLRIGYRSTFNTYGVEEHVTGDGRFSTVASFGPGDPSVFRTYWFQIASLPMGNYPFAPAASQRVPVIVGGHPGPG